MITRKIKFKWFTLVELIIVITILAILATIAFVSFQWYVKDSRDSTRLTTLKSIETWLQTFQLSTGNYPEPENYTLIQASGTTLNFQWYIWDSVAKLLKINKTPLDPIDQTKFIYSSNSQKTRYELLTHLENQISYTNKTFAADYSQRTPKILGNNIWILINQDNSPLTGNTIDILTTNSGITYKTFFSNTALSWSGKQLLSLFIINNKNLSNYDDSLVWYWDMETLTQSWNFSVLKDVSKYSNNGACYNGWTQINCWDRNGPQFIDGWNNSWKAMSFDGIDDWIRAPGNISLENQNMTIIISFKTSYDTVQWTFRNILNYQNGIWTYIWSYNIWYNQNGIYWDTQKYNVWLNFFAQHSKSSLNNSAHNVIISRLNGSQAYSYLNGNSVSIWTTDIVDYSQTPKWLIFGSPNGTNPTFQWQIDEVRIYNKSFSDIEVKEIYNLLK